MCMHRDDKKGHMGFRAQTVICDWTLKKTMHMYISSRKNQKVDIDEILVVLYRLFYSSSIVQASVVYSWSKFYPLSVVYTQSVVCVLHWPIKY